jgi:hypothetical protein
LPCSLSAYTTTARNPTLAASTAASRRVTPISPGNQSPLSLPDAARREEIRPDTIWECLIRNSAGRAQSVAKPSIEAATKRYAEYSFDVGEGGYDFDPGTLCYVGFYDRQKMFDADGTWCCMPLEIHFRWRGLADSNGNVRGWNYFLNNQAQMVQVSLNGLSTGQKPYLDDGGDFVKLFRCEP